MSSSKSKRQRAAVCSIDQTDQTTQYDATPTNDFDIEEVRKSLPPDKKLKEGRQYVVRKTKRTGDYWKHFIDYFDNGALRCECKYCYKTFACDSNVNGSKNVKKHVEKCNLNPTNQGQGKQTELFFQQGDGDKISDECEGKLKFGTVNLRDVREALVRMIIVVELPFKHVEKSGFRYLMSVACPRFNMPSRTTIARDCFQLYLHETEKLKDLLKTCQRVSLTTDTWTSIQRINYMCLTAHFIDNDWKLHKKIINFCPISSHKGEAIGKAVEACLEYWGIEDKLFSVTVDNASSNDVACAHLRKVVQRNKSNCVGDGKYLHVRCIAHILNLIVWDSIKEYGVCIDRVRNAVKYVKNSPARIQRFKDLVPKYNVESKSSLSFDVPTRWNSTYTMLDTAVKFQRVFSGMTLPSGPKENEIPPEDDDWKKVERLVVFLFYVLTKKISGSLYVTSNKGFFEIAVAYDMLNKWEKNVDSDFKAMATAMKNKYDKYWGNVEKMNKLIYVATILDPHSKWLVVELTLNDMYGKVKGNQLDVEVKEFTYTLFDEYRSKYAPNDPQPMQTSGDSTTIDLSDECDMLGEDYMQTMLERAQKLEGSREYDRSELDRYLSDRLGSTKKGMDALSWWGQYGQHYPILSHMARDVLAIPLSTVASESAFSVGGRHLDPFRSSLTPKMVQALICTQDWLRTKETMWIDIEENLREWEELEKDLYGDDVDHEVVYVDTLI